MDQPNIKTRVVHSISKSAWNVVGTTPGAKYKIARCPYLTYSDEVLTQKERQEAYEHACFISESFNKAYSASHKSANNLPPFKEN